MNKKRFKEKIMRLFWFRKAAKAAKYEKLYQIFKRRFMYEVDTKVEARGARAPLEDVL